jgi:hypothetical protein
MVVLVQSNFYLSKAFETGLDLSGSLFYVDYFCVIVHAKDKICA